MKVIEKVFGFLWKMIVGLAFGVVTTYIIDRIFGIFEK